MDQFQRPSEQSARCVDLTHRNLCRVIHWRPRRTDRPGLVEQAADLDRLGRQTTAADERRRERPGGSRLKETTTVECHANPLRRWRPDFVSWRNLAPASGVPGWKRRPCKLDLA